MPTPTNTQNYEQLTFTWDSPKNIDGEPAAAANMAVRQVRAALELLKRSMPAAELMTRNASMTEALEKSMLNDPMQWWLQSSQHSQMVAAEEALASLEEWTRDQLALYEGGR